MTKDRAPTVETLSSRLIIPEGLRRNVMGPSEIIRDAALQFHNMEPLDSDFNRGFTSIRNWSKNDVLFTHSQFDTVTVGRSRAQAEFGAHLVFVHRYLSGTIRGQIGDFNIDRDPGTIYIFDMSRRVESIQFPITLQGFYVPKWVLGYESAQHAPLLGFPVSTTVGQTLDSDFDRLFRGLLGDNTLDVNILNRVIATLKIALHGAEQEGDVRRLAREAISQTILSFIERHLETPELTVDLILREFAVSRASLYRMFDSYGGVRQYISNRRLYRAVLELSQTASRRGVVSDVADKWGFSSHANFNRSVKRAFGAAPGQLVGIPPPEQEYMGVWDRVGAFVHRTMRPDPASVFA